jgi:hypothetical protein
MPTRSRPGLAKHRRLTEARARAYKKVFGRAPAKTYKSDYFEGAGELPPVAIFVYEFAAGDQAVYAAVTSGMSDCERSDSGRELTGRRELIQYFETIREHREFSFRVDGEATCFLWHVPISEAELAQKKKHGAGALLDLMQKNRRPWIFTE